MSTTFIILIILTQQFEVTSAKLINCIPGDGVIKKINTGVGVTSTYTGTGVPFLEHLFQVEKYFRVSILVK